MQQAQPKIIVSSATNCARASGLADVRVFQLDETLLDLPEESPQLSVHSQLLTISPSDIVYISFTSGTTGVPKGACISHTNVRSAIHYQGKKLGFAKQSRVFDFAPFSFDVAWSNFLHTLGAGGCICIAPQQDMLNDLSSAITAFHATLINVTPTILRTISPIPPTLHTVLLSGEMPYRENITQWASHVRLLNTYGPTECTFKCAFSALSPFQDGRPDIGVGVGFCTWIVDPHDDHKLVGEGSVGALYLEGPLVGQGYLSDPELTASAFIRDPTWLLMGNGKFASRRGRVYKTGDLVKCKPDGRLLFVGRKDATQVKIRGQRVEIGDVEHHVRTCLAHDLPVIADIIQPLGRRDPSLTLFVQAQKRDREQVKTMIDGLAERLSKVLPNFMIPTVYIPIDEVPLASTGKVDRRRLRKMGNSLFWRKILELQSLIVSPTERCEPSNDTERCLREIWAKVLDLDPASINTTDTFLQKGGDSVAAIHMVAAAREEHLALTVADVFRTPKLSDLARAAKLQDVASHNEPIARFALLKTDRDETGLCEEVARLCSVEASQIEDVYPCTPLQEGMLAMTARKAGDYVSRTAFVLPGHLDVGRFENAWKSTVDRTPILRTRIINLSGEGLVQVVLNSPLSWSSYPYMRSSLEDTEPMGLGTPLCRAGVFRGNSCHFCLDIHHAIFDGWCTTLILDAVQEAYCGTQAVMPPLAAFQPFVKHVLTKNGPKAAKFWQDELAGPEATAFPPSNYRPHTKMDLDHTIAGLEWPRTGITPSSIIRSAIALLLASYTNSNDVRYGATTSGRQAPVPNIERIAGPTIATTPVRVRFEWD